MKLETVFRTRPVRVLSLALSAIAIASLTACGGGGSGVDAEISPAPGETFTMSAGTSTTVAGVISTDANLLTSVSWAISSMDAGAPTLLLSNDNCAVTMKTDRPYAPENTTRTGASRWQCDLGIVAPAQVAKDTKYRLVLTGVDDRGNSTSIYKTLTVTRDATIPADSNYRQAGTDFAVTSGEEVPLQCEGEGVATDYTYQWYFVDKANLPLKLTSTSASDTSFMAPSVSSPRIVRVGCKTTDAQNVVRTSWVDVTINPAPADVLVANTVLPGVVVKPGVPTTIDGFASWYKSTGEATSGPTISYQWSLGAGAPAGTELLSTSNLSTQFYAPTSITAPTFIPLTFTASSGVQVSSSTIKVLVDPFGPLNLAVSPSALIAQSGDVVNLSASANGSSAPLFYRWSVVSGPAIDLGGASTQSLSFVAPSVTSPTQMIVRIEVGYNPISAASPAVYSADAVVEVRPASGTELEVPYADVTPGAQTVVQDQVVSIASNVWDTTATVYHKWTVVSGTATLGNDTADTVSFIASTLGTVEIEYATSILGPISASNPGVTTRAIVNVVAAPVAP